MSYFGNTPFDRCKPQFHFVDLLHEQFGRLRRLEEFILHGAYLSSTYLGSICQFTSEQSGTQVSEENKPALLLWLSLAGA